MNKSKILKMVDSKDFETGSNKTNKTEYSKIMKENSTGKTMEKTWRKFSKRNQIKQNISRVKFGK